jgi:hypothetical protein
MWGFALVTDCAWHNSFAAHDLAHVIAAAVAKNTVEGDHAATKPEADAASSS